MIISSRESEQIKDLKGFMDTEVEIRGFSESSVEAYTYKYMENEQKAEKLLKQAGDKREYFYQTFLRIPMQLNMVCSLFEVDNSSLPSSRTELLGRIVQRCINREAIRVKSCKVIGEVKALFILENLPRELAQTFLKLGELSWQKLNAVRNDYVFERVGTQNVNCMVLVCCHCLCQYCHFLWTAYSCHNRMILQ